MKEGCVIDMKEKILDELKAFPGKVSLYYKNLETGDTMALEEDYPHYAASVIKVPIMVEAFRQFEGKTAAKDETVILKDSDRVPPSGVLTFMHSGLTPSLMDLVWLMITISDNVATNLLINRLGVDAIQKTMEGMGLKNSRIERKLFDRAATDAGKNNYITARDMGELLQQMHSGRLVSQKASDEMLEVMLAQQFNSKIPFLLPPDVDVAHKTGEVENVSHDVAIVYAESPYILCLCSSGVQNEDFNAFAGRISRDIFQMNGGR